MPSPVGAASRRLRGDEDRMEHQPVTIGHHEARVDRVALFVDGDNLPPSFSTMILESAGLLGRVDLRRVYAAEAGPKGWDDAAGFRVVRVVGAKNGTDILLCIEAAEAACRGGFDQFVIASDDRDFSHLACWLREQGFPVLGLGTAKSPEVWRAACSEFELLSAGVDNVPDLAPVLTELDTRLRLAIGRKPVGKAMKDLGSLLSRQGVFPPPDGNWRAYMMTRPDLFDLDPKGPNARVRWVAG